jgi:E3 ubiquitin-protein ligase BRE1
LKEEHPDVAVHIQAEAEVRQQLASTTAQLAKYQATYGDPSTLPPDLQKMETQLRIKTEEIIRLQLLESQQAEASVLILGTYLLLTRLSVDGSVVVLGDRQTIRRMGESGQASEEQGI